MKISIIKFLTIALAVVVPAVVVFYAGVFSTSFNTNMCYSLVLSKLSERAQLAAASRDHMHMVHYARLMESLPNRGYESQCEEIRAALEAGLATPITKNTEAAGR